MSKEESTSAPGASEDRWPTQCDLVMKGGITSGVVYPSAVEVIARSFRLRSLGGASAGAIAAAGAAAAQYRKARQTDPTSNAPFEAFAKMAVALGEPGVLRGLFRPQQTTAQAWRILEPLILGRSWRKLRGLASPEVVALVLLTVGVVSFAVWTIAARDRLAPDTLATFAALALLAVVVEVLLIVVLQLIGVARAIQRNRVGLCTGMPDVHTDDGLSMADMAKDPQQSGVLTAWLHRRLQDIAQLPDDEPLTFGHLWGSPCAETGDPDAPRRALDRADPGYLDARRRQESEPAAREITLELITTDLTFGRPQRIPFRDQLFVKRRDLFHLMPREVARWMIAHAAPVDVPGDDATLVALPPAWDLPVIFAVRLSLSFPVLFSVVPLYRRVLDSAAQSLATLARCWFSDGGLLSNFPIHLFDQLLPTHPTFGINLRYDNADTTKVVFPSYDELAHDASQPAPRPDDDRRDLGAFGGVHAPRLTTFAVAMLAALQDWQDNSQMRLPGFRDRVVHISLRRGLGGLNVNMSPAEVTELIEKGAEAGKVIRDAFARDGADAQKDDRRINRWEIQRGMRYRCAAAMLERMLVRLGHASPSYDRFMSDRGARAAPWTNAAQLASARDAVSTLGDLGGRLGAHQPERERLDHDAPTPRLVLRATGEQQG